MTGVDRACWRETGTSGDRTCPGLAEHVHCRNCDVFAAAGRSLLDREPPADAGPEAPPQAPDPPREGTVPVVVFRLGDEWFAWPTASLQKVVTARRPHAVPHRRAAGFLGLVNVDGELVLCGSLATVLLAAPGRGPAPPQAGRERLLVLADGGRRWACPVDEVAGVHRAAPEADPPPATLARSATSHSRGLFRAGGRRVDLLDVEPVLAGLAAAAAG